MVGFFMPKTYILLKETFRSHTEREHRMKTRTNRLNYHWVALCLLILNLLTAEANLLFDSRFLKKHDIAYAITYFLHQIQPSLVIMTLMFVGFTLKKLNWRQLITWIIEAVLLLITVDIALASIDVKMFGPHRLIGSLLNFTNQNLLAFVIAPLFVAIGILFNHHLAKYAHLSILLVIESLGVVFLITGIFINSAQSLIFYGV